MKDYSVKYKDIKFLYVLYLKRRIRMNYYIAWHLNDELSYSCSKNCWTINGKIS